MQWFGWISGMLFAFFAWHTSQSMILLLLLSFRGERTTGKLILIESLRINYLNGLVATYVYTVNDRQYDYFERATRSQTDDSDKTCEIVYLPDEPDIAIRYYAPLFIGGHAVLRGLFSLGLVIALALIFRTVLVFILWAFVLIALTFFPRLAAKSVYMDDPFVAKVANRQRRKR